MIILDMHSSVTAMLTALDWKSLEKRRDDSTVVMFYKTINQHVDIPYDHILHKVPSTTRSIAVGNSYTYPQELIPSCIHFFQEPSDCGINYPITS